MKDQMKRCENTAKGTVILISLPLFFTQPQPTCEKLISELKKLGGLVLWENPGLVKSLRGWVGEGPPRCHLLPCSTSTASPALSSGQQACEFPMLSMIIFP